MTTYPEIALRTRITAGGPVRALVEARIYPQKAPQNAARPYGVYQRISSNPERHMGGAAELAQARIQFTWYADTWQVARDIADGARWQLDGFKGAIAVGADAFYVRHLSLENEADNFIDPTAGSDDGVHAISQDWLLFYVLPAPTLT